MGQKSSGKEDHMQEAYADFARIYDVFQDNIDYEGWKDYILELFRDNGITDGLVLDLGCGTGTLTELLAGAGYDMIGVDSSEEMLMEAFEKRLASGHDILYLQQDMTEFELYGTVRAVVSVCDSLNYLLEEEELLAVFRLVNNYLDPGGIFVFDMNTTYKYRSIGEQTIAENREEGSFIWENEYDDETGINTCALTLFLPAGNGLYEKKEEFHVQRGFEAGEILRLLEKAGLKAEGVYQAYTRNIPDEKTGRLTFIARERGKNG